MMIKTAQMTLELEQKSHYQSAQKLRGFFANTFSDIDLFHNHEETGEPIYRYPRIQYRFLHNRPVILGFNEGVEIIKNNYDKFKTIRIGHRDYMIMEKSLNFQEAELSLSHDIQYYEFLTPWYPLNQANYKEYLKLQGLKSQEEFLSKILITNILRMCKEMNYHVKEQIEVSLFVQPVKATVKDIEIMSFTGDFKSNMILPDYIGLGKSISKGFGTIQRRN